MRCNYQQAPYSSGLRYGYVPCTLQLPIHWCMADASWACIIALLCLRSSALACLDCAFTKWLLPG
jgi:hypothetical protein